MHIETPVECDHWTQEEVQEVVNAYLQDLARVFGI